MRKLDLKASAQKRTSNATASPESLAKKRSGNSEEEVMAMCTCCSSTLSPTVQTQ